MKKVYIVLILIMTIFLTNGNVMAKTDHTCDDCTKINSGELYAPDGSLVGLGFDQWGFNYQARKYEGTYCNSLPYLRPGSPGHYMCNITLGSTGRTLKDMGLTMKWNDAYISNKDCDGDSELDRHFGFESYISSGAWIIYTRYLEYEYEGEICRWENFVKAIAVPEGSYLFDNLNPMILDMWYTSDGEEIGYSNPFPGEGFATVKLVYEDPCGGYPSGVVSDYLSPLHPGLGGW